MKAILFAVLVSGCSWTEFDDLSDQTPLRAQEKPDGVKSSDYGVVVVGATAPTETSGGRVAVLSTGPGNFSTLELDGGGTSQSLGDSETLGQHTIDSLTASATILFDGTSQVALIDNSNVGTIVAVTGSVMGLSVDQQVPTSAKPDASAFSNGEIIVTATATASTPQNAFSVKGSQVVSCTALDNTGMNLTAAAVAIDNGKVWVYAKSGAVFSYPLTAFDTMASCASLAISPGTAMTTAPTGGGHIDIVAGKYAVVTAFDPVGMVTVIDTSNFMPVGSPLAAAGVKSATFNTFDGQGVVVLGYPNRANADVMAAGAVDLHKIDAATGALDTSPTQTLSISNPSADLVFGRSVTTTNYNGKPIIVVAASNTLYSYYATALYTKR